MRDCHEPQGFHLCLEECGSLGDPGSGNATSFFSFICEYWVSHSSQIASDSCLFFKKLNELKPTFILSHFHVQHLAPDPIEQQRPWIISLDLDRWQDLEALERGYEELDEDLLVRQLREIKAILPAPHQKLCTPTPAQGIWVPHDSNTTHWTCFCVERGHSATLNDSSAEGDLSVDPQWASIYYVLGSFTNFAPQARI